MLFEGGVWLQAIVVVDEVSSHLQALIGVATTWWVSRNVFLRDPPQWIAVHVGKSLLLSSSPPAPEIDVPLVEVLWNSRQVVWCLDAFDGSGWHRTIRYLSEFKDGEGSLSIRSYLPLLDDPIGFIIMVGISALIGSQLHACVPFDSADAQWHLEFRCAEWVAIFPW